MEFLFPVHDILLRKLCINCNFNFKESYNHSKLLIIFKGDNLRSLLMRGSRKFCQRGSNFDNDFFFDFFLLGSKKHYKRTIIGPPAKRH